MKRFIGAAVLIVVLAGCTRKQPPAEPHSEKQIATDPNGEVHFPPDSPQLSRIKVAAVEMMRQPLDEVVAPGKVEANPNRVARVAMPAAGRVRRVMVGIGDAVREGQPVLSIESPEASTATSNLRQAQARLDEAKAGIAKAEADQSRVKDLYENRAIAQKEVLAAEAALAQARSSLEQAQAAREESARHLEILDLKSGEANQEIIVRAPVSGKVLEIAVAAGEYRNDTSAPLLTIADLSTVYMAADVPESQIRLVTRGERVDISLSAYPNEAFTGTVARIADTVDPQTRTIKVRAELRNPGGRLRPEMFGQMRHEESFRQVPFIPAGAVIQSDKQNIVYREKQAGVFEPVVVTFGKQHNGKVPVLSGLREGDRVVVDGTMLLKAAL